MNGKIKLHKAISNIDFSLDFYNFLVLDFFKMEKFLLFIFKVMHALYKISNSVKVKKLLIFIPPVLLSTPQQI